MRPYETLVVLSNELGENKKALVERLEQVIRNHGGTVEANHDWGNRRLAYTIGKHNDGHYFLLEYQAEGAAVAEVERTLRISDGVLRYLSLQQEHTGLPQVRPRETTSRDSVPLYELRGRGEGGGRRREAEEEGETRVPEREEGGSEPAPAAGDTE